MEFKLLYFAYLVLCVIAIFDILFTIRKNSLLKICFLLIIFSVFVMNYFTYISITNRFQFVLVKCMRLVYACSLMLAVIHLVTGRIPRWVTGIITFSTIFLIGIRIYFFDRIAIDVQSPLASQIFAVGPELNSPAPFARYAVFALAALVTALTFYYYRVFLLTMSIENIDHKHFSRWILSMVIPFFLLVIFGILGTLNLYPQSLSQYLFSLFSFIVIFSILFRPKMLNTTSYFHRRYDNPLVTDFR